MGISIYQQGVWVNKIFKQYKVIDDVAEIIQKKVHNDQMKVICWVIKKMFDNEWGGYFYKNDCEGCKERSRRGREFVNKKENKHFVEKAFVGDITEKYLIMNILLYKHHGKIDRNDLKYLHRYNDECIYHPSFSVDGVYKYRIHELCKGDFKKFKWKSIYRFRVNKLYGKKIYKNSEMKEILDENEWSYNSKSKKIDLVNRFWKKKDNNW